MRRLTLSDGKNFVSVLSNHKPEVHALIQEKKEGVKNAIATVSVKATPHPTNSAIKLVFVQTLTIVQEGAAKIGEPKKYEPEDMATDTVAVAVTPQAEVIRPFPCSSPARHPQQRAVPSNTLVSTFYLYPSPVPYHPPIPHT